MSEELKVTVFEPSKDPHTVSMAIEPEFIPLIERGVYFNKDGSLCDDFEELPEDLSPEESIGFDTSVPRVKSRDTSIPKWVSVPPGDAVDHVIHKQRKLQNQINHLEKIKGKIFMKNKLKKLRKKLKWAQKAEVALTTDPESYVAPGTKSQPQQIKNPVNSTPNANPNPPGVKKPPGPKKPPGAKKFRGKKPPGANKKPAFSKSAPNASQPPNPHRFPAFIRNPWTRKNPPNSAPRMNRPSNNPDFIPIRNNQPRFHHNNRIPPMASSNRYFSLDNC